MRSSFSAASCRWLVWLILGQVCCLLSSSPQALAVDPDNLSAVLEPLAKEHAGDVAISVRVWDAESDTWTHWSRRGEVPMPTASLIKFPVMIETYRQAHAGELDLDQLVTLEEEDQVPGSGLLTDHFSPGARFSLRDAVRLMIRYSDNTATNLVIDQIGLESTSRLMGELGYPETQLHAKVFRRDTSIAPERSEKYGLGSTTADAMTELLVRLDEGELVSAEASRAMLEHLMTCSDTSKLPRLLPDDCKIAHKTGSVNRSRTVAGLVYCGEQRFAVCILTDNNKDTSWSDDNAAHVLCSKVARAIYDEVQRVAEPDAENPSKPLSEGAAGELVEALQRTLNARIDAGLSIDGDFGPATAAAVKSFQRTRDLEPSGVVDSKTWESLGELLTEAEPVADPEVINSQTLERTAAIDPHAPPAVTAKAWAIADAVNGSAIAGGDADQELPMASTTKVMTAYLVMDFAKTHPEVLKEIVTFSKRADETGGSTAGVREGEQLSVRELLYGLMLPSGNDASVALAEHFGQRLSGETVEEGSPQPASSYAGFIDAMNRKAVELGLEHTHFENPHGLTADGHYSSAADLARLASAALELPLMREVIQCRQRGCRLQSVDGYMRNVRWDDTNRLLAQEGFVGMKTGTTSAAGDCLIAVGERDGTEHVVVVLGSDSSSARYIDARNLFAWLWRQ